MLTEAVTNILKHSDGNIVTIELEQVDNNICLFISDNGVVSELSFGNGLNGIRERCQKLNGTVKVSHQQGMSIKISLPGNIND
jgi:two-component system sensor histidine kinase DesK